MTIKEILKRSAMLCEKNDAIALLDGNTPVSAEIGANDLAFLRTSYAFAIEEIADRVGAPVTKESVQSSGFVNYTSLTDAPVKILTVNGKAPEGVTATGFSAPAGSCEVEYLRHPKVGADTTAPDILAKVPQNALVWYIASEVMARDGLEERSERFAEKYESLLKGISQKKGGRIPAVRWRG